MKDKNNSERTVGRRDVIKGAATAGLITATGMHSLVYAAETKPARRDLIQRENARQGIIVLWSDHGFQLGEKERWAKYSLWERATRVNMVWVAPGVTKPGSICAKPVNLLDIYPTLASLTGCKPPQTSTGRKRPYRLDERSQSRMEQDIFDDFWL